VADLLTLEAALERVLERVHPLGSEQVLLDDAAGRVLARDALAAVDLPPFPSSAMDGFAVRSEDTPGTLPVAFRVAAGSPSPDPLPERATAGIATGGAVPDGADAVVPVELTSEHDGLVEIAAPASPGAHIRPRGGDVRAGEVVVEAGSRLGAAQVGALAAAGVATVTCAARPRVALLATGSELRAPGERLAPGQIYESNRTTVAVVLEGAGAVVERLPVVVDEDAAHAESLSRALESDVVVTTGGVSVGPHDLVRASAAGLGVEEVFWGVAVKPGKPLSFGIRGSTLVFGLPGNPVSALVGALLFVRPAVLALQGALHPEPPLDAGRLATPLRRDERRDEFVRARREAGDDGALLRPVSGQDSHMIVRAAAADALVHVPRGTGELRVGETVRYLPLT